MWYNAPWNAEIIRFIQSFSNSFLDNFFVLTTMMGEETFFMVAAAFIFWCVDKFLGYKLGFSYLTGAFLNGFLKDLFQVPRPIGEPGIRSLRAETALGDSFPSGHSQNATTFWTFIMIHAKKKWMYALGTILILLTAISRLYLGVHRPVDVIAGIAIALLWVYITNIVFNYAQKTGKKAILLLFIIPVFVLLFINMDSLTYKVGGTLFAFFVGYLIEPKYIKFETKASLPGQILKLAVGLAVLFGLKEFLKPLLPESIYSDFARYFILGLWVTVFAPWVFMTVSRCRKSSVS